MASALSSYFLNIFNYPPVFFQGELSSPQLKTVKWTLIHCHTPRLISTATTFRVGNFWWHIDILEIRGRCHHCQVPESLEHIALECNAQGRDLIWNWTQQLWSMKYTDWPTLSWGLILGCNLVRFKSERMLLFPQKEDCMLFWCLSPGIKYGTYVPAEWLHLQAGSPMRRRFTT
jgi:hypothetical protein